MIMNGQVPFRNCLQILHMRFINIYKHQCKIIGTKNIYQKSNVYKFKISHTRVLRNFVLTTLKKKKMYNYKTNNLKIF